MIPYVVSEPTPGNPSEIYTSYGVCEDYTLTAHLIKTITEIMYEFCSADYGHGLTITSYADFCQQWWDKQFSFMPNTHNTPFYAVHYYWRGEWMEWKTEDHELELYWAYVALKESSDKS